MGNYQQLLHICAAHGVHMTIDERGWVCCGLCMKSQRDQHKRTIDLIVNAMSVPEWSPTTLDEIAEVLRVAGHDINNPEEGN
jgi:hypothetical protein